MGQQPCHRQQHHQLAAHRGNQTVQRVADSLTHGTGNDVEARQHEGHGDDPQSHGADGEHLLRGVEEHQQLLGEELENQASHSHDGHGGADGQLDGPLHPGQAGGAVVIADDGHHAVVQAEHRHEDEALKLEVCAEHGGGRLGEGEEDLVHAEHHGGADGLHDDGGEAHPVDLRRHLAVPADLPGQDVDVRIAFEVQHQGSGGSHNLPCHRGNGGAGHLHPGQAEPAEDQDGVQHDVDEGAGKLGAHGQERAAGGLQQPLKAELAENTDGAAQADGGVIHAVVDNHLFSPGLQLKEGPGEEDADQGE